VRFICSTTNLIDERPLLRILKADVRLDLGWYSYVSCVCLAKKFQIEKCYMPKYIKNDDISSQDNYFSDYLQ